VSSKTSHPRRQGLRVLLRLVRLSGVTLQRGVSPKTPGAAASLTVVACSILMFVLSACAQGPRIEIVGADGTPRAAVSVEVADTNSSREYGLMFRKQMDKDAGMIFVFKAPQHQQFWMKNTIIPLDMIFADSNGRIIGIVRKAEPFSESIDAVDGDSQYVLEVNGGFCGRHGVKPGDSLRFEGTVPQAAE
jgi:uncharacterized membrane protein (UPF0127 family)